MANDQLCVDDLTGAYFYSTESYIEMAVLSMYSLIHDYGFVSKNKWLKLLNLAPVSDGDMVGWNNKNIPFDVVYSKRLLPNGKYCLVIIHENNPPKPNYK